MTPQLLLSSVLTFGKVLRQEKRLYGNCLLDPSATWLSIPIKLGIPSGVKSALPSIPPLPLPAVTSPISADESTHYGTLQKHLDRPSDSPSPLHDFLYADLEASGTPFDRRRGCRGSCGEEKKTSRTDSGSDSSDDFLEVTPKASTETSPEESPDMAVTKPATTTPPDKALGTTTSIESAIVALKTPLMTPEKPTVTSEGIATGTDRNLLDPPKAYHRSHRSRMDSVDLSGSLSASEKTTNIDSNLILSFTAYTENDQREKE
ncbi:hypothetical protein F5Y18DRAFT_433007 [Xylariaceae sp. FL1019]|nr:hypothetical protein F5Y18DRAFT_433007 [Xylariaceae sp. FL1019]